MMTFTSVRCVLDIIRLMNSLSQIKVRFPRNLCWIQWNVQCNNGRIRQKCDRVYDNIVKYEKVMVSNYSLWLSWSKLKMLSIHEQIQIKNGWISATYFLRILESNSSTIFISKLRISINLQSDFRRKNTFSSWYFCQNL